MAELIEREALISFIDCGHLRSPSEKCYSELDIVNLLKTQKVVDAVPVVRCGECKYHKIVNYTYVCCFHNAVHLKTANARSVHDYGICMGTQDFCSYGERTGAEGNT